MVYCDRNSYPHDLFKPILVYKIASDIFLRWGWLAFNSGSTYGVSGYKWMYAARAGVATIMGSIGGGLVGLTFSLLNPNGIDILSQINGILGALVAVTGNKKCDRWKNSGVLLMIFLMTKVDAFSFERGRHWLSEWLADLLVVIWCLFWIKFTLMIRLGHLRHMVLSMNNNKIIIIETYWSLQNCTFNCRSLWDLGSFSDRIFRWWSHWSRYNQW